jgi:hypothetical protein
MSVKPAAHTLTGLRISEVSLVDFPANTGATHILYKRKDPPMTATTKSDGAFAALLTRLGLRKSAADRFDPDSYADASADLIGKAQSGLAESLQSILADASVTDKTAAIAKSLDQFGAFVEAGVCETIEKAMSDVAQAVTEKGQDMPTADELTAANAELTRRVAKMERELAIAKMSQEHADYASAADMSKEDQDEFAAKTPAERDEHMKKHPIKKSPLPEHVQKALDDAVAMRKRLDVLEGERELETMRKRASEIGIGAAHAETILKASQGDPKAFGDVLNLLKAATEQARVGKLFGEFGSAGSGAPGSAQADVAAAAEVLAKADPKLSVAAARTQIRKSRPDLAQRERNEERAARTVA